MSGNIKALVVIVMLLISIVYWSSCQKDLNKISASEWQPEIALPFIQTDLSLRNIINSTDHLQTDDDSLLIYYYQKDSLFHLTADSLLTFSAERSDSSRYSMGSIRFDTFQVKAAISLNALLPYLPQDVSDTLVKYEGETHIFPPLIMDQPFTLVSDSIQEFNYLDFSDGFFEIDMTNGLPVAVQGLRIRLVDVLTNVSLKEFEIASLQAGEVFQDILDLGGKTLGNQISFELIHFSSNGSLPDSTLIDLTNNLVVRLTAREAAVVSGEGILSEQVIVSDSRMFELNTEHDAAIQQIGLSVCGFDISLASEFQVAVHVTLELPTALWEGSVPSIEFTIPPYGEYHGYWALGGVDLDLGTDSNQAYNRFPVDMEIQILASGSIVSIDSSDQVFISYTLSDLKVDQAEGDLGDHNIHISPDTISLALDFLNQLEGELILEMPSIKLSYSNGFGVPLKLFPAVTAFNSATGKSQALDADSISIESPEIQGETSMGSFQFDKSNSSIVDFIAIRPDHLIYGGGCRLNWEGSHHNFITAQLGFMTDVELNIPMLLRSKNLFFTDTVRIGPWDKQSLIHSGNLKLLVDNGFPFEMLFTLKIPDSISGEILAVVDFDLIESAPVDAQGKVITSNRAEASAHFGTAFFDGLQRANHALLEVRAHTYNNGHTPVALHADYEMGVAIGIELTVNPY